MPSRRGDREQLFQELLDANIPYAIEPGVNLQSCEEILQLYSEYPVRVFPAIGIHPARKLGGVVHCFYGSKEIVEQYLKLGYHIGIGGSVIQLEERAKDLWEAIPHIPLEWILAETDAPFILPYCKDVIQPKLLRRTRNTSLILPAVIEKVAQLKGISPGEVEQATTDNVIRLFSLSITTNTQKKRDS